MEVELNYETGYRLSPGEIVVKKDGVFVSGFQSAFRSKSMFSHQFRPFSVGESGYYSVSFE